MTTSIEPNEIVTGVRFPRWPAGHGYGFVEFARRHGDFAIASAAALLETDAGGKIKRSVGDAWRCFVTPVRVRAVEQALIGQTVRKRSSATSARMPQSGCHRGCACARLLSPASGDGDVAARAGRGNGTRGESMSEKRKVAVTINGKKYEEEVEVRWTLADFMRQQLGLTGTHLGCEHGVCGACTILFDGMSARSCLMLPCRRTGMRF
jgi:xanthine dehydrogenase iron-sulfur cluster and FAD-binding subunit A